MNKINKRGQIDKAIVELPVFFLVIVIAAVFIALFVGAFDSKNVSVRETSYESVYMPVLFEEINLEIEGNMQELTVLEAFRKMVGSSGFKKAEDEIVKLTPKNGCLAFLWTNSGSETVSPDGSFYLDPNTVVYGFFSKDLQGNKEKFSAGTKSFDSFYKNYSVSRELQKARISFSDSGFTFMTYRGKCLNA